MRILGRLTKLLQKRRKVISPKRIATAALLETRLNQHIRRARSRRSRERAGKDRVAALRTMDSGSDKAAKEKSCDALYLAKKIPKR